MVEIKVDLSGAGEISTGLSVRSESFKSVSNIVKIIAAVAGNNGLVAWLINQRVASDEIAKIIADMSKNLNSVTKNSKL